MSGVSFDVIAERYDATRGFPIGVDETIASGILAAAGVPPGARFIEPGIGTGRFALPIAKRGYPYTGIDISPRMLSQLRRKLDGTAARMDLIEADGTALPLPDASHDVAITAGMLHCVPDWRGVLNEICRVVKPGGLYIFESETTTILRRAFDIEWQLLALEYGAGRLHRGFSGGLEGVLAHLGVPRASTTTIILARWPVQATIEELLSMFRERIVSICWDIPDDVYERMMRGMELWADEHYAGRRDTVLESEATVTVTLIPL
ncbi:class I SAM-dependent methyltransferase [Labrys wisconsinensis]|jgi:SAM-dependent methyltransferase|uniref:SAM-dependent methyltransferase n=1 Tax=Labrys wisconsinensis TaxID=425677 RepID=A0ABU0JCD1_9HYPH|nr:class I SAM-dependent methyltransferase [Labrys wisconsinensis]MDQ0471043.1 SAM-dependent methyltransferase [Labrys wisconsinensis]